MLRRIFPFLTWFKDINAATVRADLVSGVTVALVLIPQSMAYAQLAGLPPYYGLYAAFIPPSIAALFGSSRQLATGPVAIVSMMTAASLEPIARVGSEGFIAYAVLLALIVGVFQLSLGLLRLGMAVNFLSHPVVNGFTNAAAIIIATSQLSMLFGVHVDQADRHYETIYRVIKAAIGYTHWPSFGMAVLAFVLMVGLRRLNPKIPSVLVAVIITTALSWATGFRNDFESDLSSIESVEVRGAVGRYQKSLQEIERSIEARAKVRSASEEMARLHGQHSPDAMKLRHELALINLRLSELKEQGVVFRADLRSYLLEAVEREDGTKRFYLKGTLPSAVKGDGRLWRLKVENNSSDNSTVVMTGGGEVVGAIPKGLPKISMPVITFGSIAQLFPMAVIISLLGFMETISIARAIATKTGQRLDPNQELIGQGLANMIGAFGQSYPVAGSFSRSAVNIQSGAETGISSIVTSFVIAATLLFFSPILYYLPQAVLAAVIMLAVIRLIHISKFIHAWQAQKYDGVIFIISFVCTLAFAPNLDRGIIIGVALSVGLYLYRKLKPGLAVLSLHPDNTLRDARRHGLKECRHIAVLRFDGPLFFVNAAYLEEQILDRVASMPDLKHILVAAHGISELDASGEEMLSVLIDQLREAGYDFSFSGLNDKVIDVLKRTHLYEKIGEDHMFLSRALAIEAIHAKAHENSKEEECPLLKVSLAE
jgi:MFS superfamily sulfate permease-like transporter